MKKIFLFISILVLTIFATNSYFQSGFPYTHDGENHLARFANYKVALREGQFPPRFAPNLFNHYGYPVFNFNYPLANILSLPLSFLKINYELTFKLLTISFVIFGLVGVWRWLSELKFLFRAKLFGLALFAVNPYLLSIIIFRGNIGEISALMILPWLFFIVEEIRNNNFAKKKISFLIAVVIFTGFLLSHNVAVLFAVPLVLVYSWFRLGPKLKLWKKILLLFSLSGLLSLWFWLPAVVEKSTIVLDSAALSQGFSNHFSSFRQLLFSPLSFGFSYLGQVDSLGLGIGLTQLFVLILAVAVIIKSLKSVKKIFQPQLLYLLTSLAALLFIFQLPFTKPLWLAIPLANFIQFPWRLNLFLSVVIIPLAALVFQASSKNIKRLLLALLIIQAISYSRAKPVDYFHKTNRDYDSFAQSTTTANENLPKSFTYNDIGDWKPGPSILDGEGSIKVNFWSGSERSYELELSESSTIVEPTMNFIGWETQVDGKKVSYINDEVIKGRIAYRLDLRDERSERSERNERIERSKFSVYSKFTQKTWPRVVGNSVSLATAVLLMGYLLIKKRLKW